MILEPRVGLRWLGCMPWFGKLLRYTQLATFTHTLSLMVENDQPLPDSLLVAAQASGSRRLGRMASRMRSEIESGATLSGELRKCGLPPLLCWMLDSSTAQPALAATLRELADDYQQRAASQAERIRVFLPLLLTVGVAGTAVAAYALMLFVPWTTALRELAVRDNL